MFEDNGNALLNLLPPTSWQCLSHPQLCQCNDLWFCLKTGGVIWSKLNKCYKLGGEKSKLINWNFFLWQLASILVTAWIISGIILISLRKQFICPWKHSSWKGYLLSNYLPLIFALLKEKLLMQCKIVELEPWSPADGSAWFAALEWDPWRSPHSAWHSTLLLACFAVRSVKTEGHPGNSSWCCQGSKQRWHSLCKALQETGMKPKRGSLLRTF